MALEIRRLVTIIDEKKVDFGRVHDVPLRKVAAVAVVKNPCAGRYVPDLTSTIQDSVALGQQLGPAAAAALLPFSAQSFGKAAIVGLQGEQEHGNALLTTVFADPVREAIGGGKAWISSMTKVAPPGTSIDVPLNCKDDVYVRSHYDGMTICLADAPLPDEIVVIMCLSNRGRLNARVGGLSYEQAIGANVKVPVTAS